MEFRFDRSPLRTGSARMPRHRKVGRSTYVLFRSTTIVVIACTAACTEPEVTPNSSEDSQDLLEDVVDQVPNNFPLLNSAGLGASYNASGYVDLSNNFTTCLLYTSPSPRDS